MFDSLFERAGALWGRLNVRERRLAVLTFIAVTLFLSVTITRKAVDRLDDLDNNVSQLQADIVNYKKQMIHRELVEQQYAKVAAQHSSAWTEAEIHDRLRGEIYRLARREPQALDERGIPENTPNDLGNLVEIPSLGKGAMAEGGEGYRQYMIPLRIPEVAVPDLVAFLERLQLSSQSLRLDKLELSRFPESKTVTASISITRTIANNAVHDQNVAPDAAPDAAPGEGASPAEGRLELVASDWSTRASEVVTVEVPDGKPYVALNAKAAGGVADLLCPLSGGASYELLVEASSKGAASLCVAGEGAEQPFPGAVEMAADGARYRYQVQFTAPSNVKVLACPRIALKDPDTVVQVYVLLLRKLPE